MLVDVHLDELDLALGGAHHLFEDRRELFAGPAPGRPKIDQHRLAARFLDHVLDEGLGRRLLDQAVGGLAAAPPFFNIGFLACNWFFLGRAVPGNIALNAQCARRLQLQTSARAGRADASLLGAGLW